MNAPPDINVELTVAAALSRVTRELTETAKILRRIEKLLLLLSAEEAK